MTLNHNSPHNYDEFLEVALLLADNKGKNYNRSSQKH